jgi:hypothetical protein
MSYDYYDGTSVDGASPLSDEELSKIVNHTVRGRFGNMYRHHDEDAKVSAITAHYADAIPPVDKNALNDTVLYYYKKLRGQMKREDIIVSGITFFLMQQGYTIPDIASFIGRVNPGIVVLRPLVVVAVGGSGASVGGENRVISVRVDGQYSRIKVRVYSTDDGRELRLDGQFAPAFSSRRLKITSASTAIIDVANERSYRLFKVFEQFLRFTRVKVSADQRVSLLLKKYSIDALPETSRLLRSLGLYQRFSIEYASQFRRLYANSSGRTSSQIAKEALALAQDAVLNSLSPEERVQVLSILDLLGLDTFYIKRELEKW